MYRSERRYTNYVILEMSGDLQLVKRVLENARDRKIAHADRIKKLQIQNVHDLFAWERDEAQAVFEVQSEASK